MNSAAEVPIIGVEVFRFSIAKELSKRGCDNHNWGHWMTRPSSAVP